MDQTHHKEMLKGIGTQNVVDSATFCLALSSLCNTVQLRLSEFDKDAYVPQLKLWCCKIVMCNLMKCFLLLNFKVAYIWIEEIPYLAFRPTTWQRSTQGWPLWGNNTSIKQTVNYGSQPAQ